MDNQTGSSLISDQFAIAAGSSVGFRHYRGLRNNQDGYHLAENPFALAAIVCDGCSGGARSEVGAQLMARLLANRAIDLIAHNTLAPRWDLALPDGRAAFLTTLRDEAVGFLRQLATHIGGSLLETTREMLLFTVVCAVLTREESFVFTLGDGVFEVNGDYTEIDENNTPAYLGYALLSPEQLGGVDVSLDFVERVSIPTAELMTLKLGSDGIEAINRRRDAVLKDNTLQGALSQFEHPPYTDKQYALQKRLTVIGIKNRHGPDDMTLIAITRKEVRHEQICGCRG